MSARPTWKGVLKISLVTIPIKVFPATESSKGLEFNQLHDACQTRVTQRKWCTSCAREVSSKEIVKGFEFETGRYVLLLDDELDAVKPESTRVIDLTQFGPAEQLDPLYVDRTYYLQPDGPLAGAAYEVMRNAMIGKLGIGKLAIYGREYLVAVGPQHRTTDTLMLYTLHHAAEIRPIEASGDLPTVSRVPPDQAKLASQVIAALSRPLDFTSFTDEHRGNLQRLIDAKIAGDEIVAVAPADAPAVVNLKDALLASLQRATKPSPAKAAPVKRMRAS
jgi:DNA end-binding protein Ku